MLFADSEVAAILVTLVVALLVLAVAVFFLRRDWKEVDDLLASDRLGEYTAHAEEDQWNEEGIEMRPPTVVVAQPAPYGTHHMPVVTGMAV